jgi:glycosyltransferase involved in cell wall biosynthesis
MENHALGMSQSMDWRTGAGSPGIRPELVKTGSTVSAGRTGCTPWLTVIMPSYCGERWIDASLNSLAAEAVEGVEVLVIDSSPTPATRDIAQTYSDRLRLRIIERCDLLSWQTKTNFGVEISDSSHICWLGVDDLWLPGRAAAARAWIQAAPEAPLHLAPTAIIDKGGRRLGVWRCPLPSNGEVGSALVMERLLVQNFVAAPAPVFRRDAWLSCGGLDENLWYTADWDIWLKLAARGPVYYHDGVTVGFRIHDGSLTVTGSRDSAIFAQQMQIVLDRHLAKLDGCSRSIERAARASIIVNTALASAARGNLRGLLGAASAVARLGPVGIHRYFRDSRIMDRVAPRVRAKLTAVF